MAASLPVKICGISTAEAAQAAVDGGASFLGFMHFERSPRNVALDAAGRIARPFRDRAKMVVVLVDPSDADIDRAMAELSPDLFQLHGKETPARVQAVIDRSGRPVIKALPVAEASDFDAARAYDGLVEHLMFDAKPPKDAERPGGHGAAYDWTLLAGRRFSRPHFLAGGLDPWNVGEAVRQSGAPLLDVSSGVERGPGVKDPALISAFLDAVRRV